MKQLLIIILAAVMLAACQSGNTNTSHAPTIKQWQSVIDQGVLQ